MLPFLLPVGVFSAVGYVLGRQAAKKNKGGEEPVHANEMRIEMIRDHVFSDESFILATEDVPLDNRYGDRVLSSDNEFSRTATVTLDIDRSTEVNSSVRSGFGKLFSSQIGGELSKTLGVRVGSQITRKIRLNFSVSPHKKVLYRVIWKQESRRGEFDIMVNGKRRFRVPYLITYGLSHSVESIEGMEVTHPPVLEGITSPRSGDDGGKAGDGGVTQ
ncbi:MAG: hypothetical protein HQL07_14550 [Nitrospirae bacterium]|nr:hypothetical protein [Magnetococcales bacterium]HAT50223.1 hypothetical protein [Alphaproteobacteria bacterium]